MAWRAEQRNCLTLVTAIDTEIGIDGEYVMIRIKLTHAHNTKISQIRVPVMIFVRKLRDMRNIFVQSE